MDISDLPALIAAFAFGPVSGVLVELIKNGLQLISTNTAGVGELANFLMGSALTFTTGLVHQKRKTKTTALFGCITGSVAMAFAAFIPFIHTKLVWNAVPFNLLKGLAICLVTMLIYKPLTPILKGGYAHERKKVSSISAK
ncbi:ECF transporter S component [Eubacterium barkeri]|uniref:Riboflavin transporter FmnP n=1 Tax=Eubacterium barkeri TaxID=1528 RepID=A0A1H3FR53_EUBBA|nr:ECF transporter S component [Eubacterium barkeri]SDX93267.1 Riboflavin transporter FmnP [Eubacterium barkeri]